MLILYKNDRNVRFVLFTKTSINFLLDAGADVTTAGPGISMLLIPALRIGHDKIVALLIEAGVDVNDFALGKSSASRVNPLTCLAKVAAFYADYNKYMRSVKCAQLLLKAGVHVNKKFMDRSALTWYCYQNRHPDEIFIKLLYAAGQVVEWQELVDCAGRHVFIPEWLQGKHNPEGNAMVWYLDQKFRLLDETFIKLLYAAGEAVGCPMLEHRAGRCALVGVETVRKRKKCGDHKDLCRVLIRTQSLTY